LARIIKNYIRRLWITFENIELYKITYGVKKNAENVRLIPHTNINIFSEIKKHDKGPASNAFNKLYELRIDNQFTNFRCAAL
jgi:hypothetical protein